MSSLGLVSSAICTVTPKLLILTGPSLLRAFIGLTKRHVVEQLADRHLLAESKREFVTKYGREDLSDGSSLEETRLSPPIDAPVDMTETRYPPNDDALLERKCLEILSFQVDC